MPQPGETALPDEQDQGPVPSPPPRFNQPFAAPKPFITNEHPAAKKCLHSPRGYAILRAILSWGYSSVGRAFEWHSKGQEFDSPYLHHKKGRKQKAGKGSPFLFPSSRHPHCAGEEKVLYCAH